MWSENDNLVDHQRRNAQILQKNEFKKIIVFRPEFFQYGSLDVSDIPPLSAENNMPKFLCLFYEIMFKTIISTILGKCRLGGPFGG